jgi:ribonuclease-3
MSRQTSNSTLEPLQDALGYVFRDGAILASALTHASTGEKNYERLEFLGDRVLGLVVAETLYEKFPGEVEGDLAKRLAALVRGELLAKIAANLNLGTYISLSTAERSAGGGDNENILADALEALIGAVYLDGGLPPCRKLIATLWDGHFEDMKTPPMHPKTAVQEWAQGRGLPLPEYKISGQSGPDHAPIFAVTLSVPGYDDVTAEGRSRQAAEKEAARIFMEKIS